eukprot:Gregarina_sp_Poly_1__1434@NODE_1358_length_4303_cov_15_668791_g910_i0_p2_GENE_NODE_1358_length_4303_cov_15_668791_g910_i0NODE_1358_length_4303_cov_15_668791_g910_i0_p2_ORF_typecomplete_len299_score27_20XhlA/PF10779_9/9_5e02XhlA/PF10779_9/0_38Goodbye/PF17109_5/0_68Goodbye/PF17109_5/9_9e02RNA_pol_Rpb1_1/PF04997_12/0_25_NODE_1358_length_4303_cov_15_668791_g910_i04701366
MRGKGLIRPPRNSSQWKHLFYSALISCTEFLKFETNDGLMVMGCTQFGEHSCSFETTYKHTAIHCESEEFILSLSPFDQFRLWDLISMDAIKMNGDGSIRLTRRLLTTILNHVGNIESVLYAYHHNIGHQFNIDLPPCKSLYDFLEKLATKLNELGQRQARFESLRLASTEILKFSTNRAVQAEDIISDWKRYLAETFRIPSKADPKPIYFRPSPPVSRETEGPRHLFEDLFRVPPGCMRDKSQIKLNDLNSPLMKYYNRSKDIQKIIDKLKNQVRHVWRVISSCCAELYWPGRWTRR